MEIQKNLPPSERVYETTADALEAVRDLNAKVERHLTECRDACEELRKKVDHQQHFLTLVRDCNESIDVNQNKQHRVCEELRTEVEHQQKRTTVCAEACSFMHDQQFKHSCLYEELRKEVLELRTELREFKRKCTEF
jgi:Cdc6-like AAA superfamily ATPase